MLSALQIKNYALIEELNINFDEGFSIITGETGAGKSILLGALSLILGQRADTGVLRNSDKKAVVEGTFNISNYNLKSFFESHELDYEPTTIIRREISAAGKSRAFINDTPVNLQQLKEIGTSLVDVHSQHQTLKLNESNFQLDLIDAYAGQLEPRASYRKLFQNWKSLKLDLAELEEQEQKARLDHDYYMFQLNELVEADLKEDEQNEIEEELKTLQHSEEIKSGLYEVSHGLCDGEQNVLSDLNSIQGRLSTIASYHSGINDLNERLASCKIELEDLAGELESLQNHIGFEPERLTTLNERIDLIYQLQRKHGVQSNAELIDIQFELEKKVSGTDELSGRIEELKKSIEKKEKELLKNGEKLSKARKTSFSKLEKQVKSILSQIGMPNAVLKIEHQLLKVPDVNGIDRIQFLFSANKGLELREVGKVASGGELSRLMLALKAIMAELTALPTIIFDEIDTGVSGDIASKMAQILKKMSSSMQVLSITHLPQVAAKGDAHYKVFKEDLNGKTYSQLVRLDEENRLEEVAKMLSGEEISNAALENAKELLSN